MKIRKKNIISTKKTRSTQRKKKKKRKQDLDQEKSLGSPCFSFINSHLRPGGLPEVLEKSNGWREPEEGVVAEIQRRQMLQLP